ncbi:MAG: response regulator [Desulfosarcinaceae bacterium]|nr:response regulator [Desulfosarcinaceae bacterium]
MSAPMRILIVGADDDTAERVLEEIRSGGYRVESKRANTAIEMRALLEAHTWDGIIASEQSAGFGEPSALELHRSNDLDQPFIVVSASSSAEAAVNAMRSGAHDYILQHNLKRLVPALEREVRESAQRRKERETRARLETRLRQTHKMEAMGTLAGGIAHDFNNILSAIFGYAELAQSALLPDDPSQPFILEVIKAGERARELVRQILAFSRQTELEVKPVQLAAVVEDTLRLMRASLPTTIEIHQALETKALILGDPSQIHQVLMNLCTNAGHAMQAQGGTLTVSLKHVELDDFYNRTYPDLKPGPYVQLSVSDTGHGMRPQVLERLFDPFFTTKPKGEGTGMGLAMVHGIVQELDGVIDVYSEPGKGSSFNLLFPAIERRTAPETRTTPHLPGGTERILIVDDEVTLTDLGRRLLESLGYTVKTFNDPLAAFAYFEREAQGIDLVLTDMTMPGLTGDQLAQKMMAVRGDIPIVLCTGFSINIDEERAKDMGIRAFINKPILRGDLAAVIRRVLDLST